MVSKGHSLTSYWYSHVFLCVGLKPRWLSTSLSAEETSKRGQKWLTLCLTWESSTDSGRFPLSVHSYLGLISSFSGSAFPSTRQAPEFIFQDALPLHSPALSCVPGPHLYALREIHHGKFHLPRNKADICWNEDNAKAFMRHAAFWGIRHTISSTKAKCLFLIWSIQLNLEKKSFSSSSGTIPGQVHDWFQKGHSQNVFSEDFIQLL